MTESEWTSSFFHICIFCIFLKSGWLILCTWCTWLANGMLWSGQFVHPEIWLASHVHMAWPMGCSGLVNELRGGNSGCPLVLLCHRLYLLGAGPPSWWLTQSAWHVYSKIVFFLFRKLPYTFLLLKDTIHRVFYHFLCWEIFLKIIWGPCSYYQRLQVSGRK